tara:strand:+ start:702 stop:938 length:237 start_codon:yes stop_codon:yes gene_type:complete
MAKIDFKKKKGDKKTKEFFKKKAGFGKNNDENQTRVLTGRQVSLVARDIQTEKQVTLKIVGVNSGAVKNVTVTLSPKN